MCTSGFLGRGSTVKSHEDGGEGHVALHAVLPDAVQDGHGEVDVEVTQEHDAVVVLEPRRTRRRITAWSVSTTTAPNLYASNDAICRSAIALLPQLIGYPPVVYTGSKLKFEVSSCKNYRERSPKPHNSHPLTVIGWNTVYLDFEWLVVRLAFVYDLGAQAACRDRFF